VAVSVAVVVLAVAVVADMAQAPAQSHALVVVVAEAVAIAQAIILNPALAIHALLGIHVLPLVLIVLLIHDLHALLTPVPLAAIALVTHVHQPALVLLNPKLAVNAEALAATKYGSPSSSPFCMESSRFW
jgi:hypothetical protein